MIGNADSDVVFFDLIHSMLDAECERRGHERLDYNSIQLVAPCDGKNLPTQAEFLQVHCVDLSERGICFAMSQQPTHGWFVVALGAVPFVFVKAKVCTTTEVGNNGATEFRVGCEFVAKIEP